MGTDNDIEKGKELADMENADNELVADLQYLIDQKKELVNSINDNLSEFESHLLENVQAVMADLHSYVEDMISADFNVQNIQNELGEIESLKLRIGKMQKMLSGFTEMSKEIIVKGADSKIAAIPCNISNQGMYCMNLFPFFTHTAAHR